MGFSIYHSKYHDQTLFVNLFSSKQQQEAMPHDVGLRGTCGRLVPQQRGAVGVGFYDLGVTGDMRAVRKWSRVRQRSLTCDIFNAFQYHDLDMLCLCGLGVPSKDPHKRIRKRISQQVYFSELMNELAPELALSSTEESPAFDVIVSGAYVNIVKLSTIASYRVEQLTELDPDQPWQTAVLMLVKFNSVSHMTIPVVNVCMARTHNQGFTQQGLTPQCRHNAINSILQSCALQPHALKAGSFIIGGNFSSGEMMSNSLFSAYDCPEAAPHKRIQVVLSHSLSARPGDLAIVKGLHAVQENSAVGASHNASESQIGIPAISRNHDLVIARACQAGGSPK